MKFYKINLKSIKLYMKLKLELNFYFMETEDPTSYPHVYAENRFVSNQKFIFVMENLLNQCSINKNVAYINIHYKFVYTCTYFEVV